MADSKAADVAPQSDNLQHPYPNGHHNHDVENRLDAGRHGDVAIDQIQHHAYNHQCDHDVYQGHVISSAS
jgi:hypothetical protein